MQNNSKTKSGPQTSGATIHQAHQYDLFAGLLGTGDNRPNSRMVVEMAKIKPGDKVLDVGCGTGSLTLTAKRYAGTSGSAYGIDASPEMIAVACKKAQSSGLEAVFEVRLIENLGYPNDTFDVVISRLVIHHLPDDLKRQAFAEIFRVLKPGGMIFIADFKPPANPILAHVALAMVGHRMMQTDVQIIPGMLTKTGFVEVASGPTRSAFLAFVSGRKPAA
jgi:demethylmenaquinone methyltransferase/2-methoxy-6-polyprenyl-1,4-benzoquinol methylase/phosphoethanolamine N-methyltransferase